MELDAAKVCNSVEYDESRELLGILNGDDSDMDFVVATDQTTANSSTELEASGDRSNHIQTEDPESLVFGAVNPPLMCTSTMGSSGSGEEQQHEVLDKSKVEEKKRRNREAARQSRAKKKKIMESIEQTHTQIEREKFDLRKENDALRTMNQALERQVAFFQSLFRSTFASRAPLLPESVVLPDQLKDPATSEAANPDDSSSSKRSRTGKSKSRVSSMSSNLAMGIAFIGFITLGKVTDLDAVLPSMELLAQSSAEHFAVSRHVGRILLALDPAAEKGTQVALLVAVVLSVIISAWMLNRGVKWLLRKDGWRKLVLPKHHQS